MEVRPFPYRFAVSCSAYRFAVSCSALFLIASPCALFLITIKIEAELKLNRLAKSRLRTGDVE
jgi:hypothetical protein